MVTGAAEPALTRVREDDSGALRDEERHQPNGRAAALLVEVCSSPQEKSLLEAAVS